MNWLEKISYDVRHAIRALARCPGFTASSILILTLGIGANTAIFSLLNSIMLRPLPYPEPERLVRLYRTTPQADSWPHSTANYFDFREQQTVFTEMAAFTWDRFSLAEPGQPAESVRGLSVSPSFFSVLGVSPNLGRLFTAEEDQPGKDKVALLSHQYWSSRFAADPAILGRPLRINGEHLTVVGVMPKSMDYPQLWDAVEAWRPLAWTPEERQQRQAGELNIVARLKPDITVKQAQAALRGLAAQLEKAHPDINARQSVRLAPLPESIGDGASRRFAWLMLALTGFVLLIACVNLANLQLARGTTRARELAVRLALGVGRGRLTAQLLMESLILGLLGGGGGVLLGIWLSQDIGRRLTRWSPEGIDIAPDPRVLCFALACSIGTGLLFGIIPAWVASGTKMNAALKAGARGATASRSHQWLRHALIVGEVALALVLLAGAGLVIRGLNRFTVQNPGWRVEGLLIGSLPQTGANYDTGEKRRAFAERLEERLSALPGVLAAGLTTQLPLWNFGASRFGQIEGKAAPRAGEAPVLESIAVTPGYFKAVEIGLKEGRLFTRADDATQKPVVLINEAMARHFWPAESPIGKRLAESSEPNPRWLEIVGVVNDVRFPANLGRPETLWQIYRPLAQEPRPYVTVALRTATPPEAFSQTLRGVIAELDPDLPVNSLNSARHSVDRILQHFTIAGHVLGAFAILGVVLAALGIYGVISYFIAQRTPEIGIRIALGAQLWDVLKLVLGKGMALCLLGVALGLTGAFGMTFLLRAAAPELPSRDPLALIGTSCVLIVVALLACVLPARRAARVDPVLALRSE